MVFSSIPAYIDPSNWQQQHPNDQNGGNGSSAQLNQLVPLAQPPPPPPPPPPPQTHVGGIRPGSMAERARLANISLPETALKCPRCESSNTKFCYFNNYSLSQPRHFCKTCRRYWTRGGALRSVPVGGGCRRNKRTKSGGATSKSPVSSDRQTTSSSTGTVSSNNIGSAGNLLGLTSSQIPPLRFLSPLGQFSDHYNSGDISLSYSGLSSPSVEPNFQTNLLNGLGGGISNPLEQWRLQQLQQFPFLGGALESTPGMYQFQGSGEPSNFLGETSHHMRPKVSSSLLAQLGSVKMEENHGLNLSRQLMGISGNDPWTGAAWTDLSSFSSSSTSNAL